MKNDTPKKDHDSNPDPITGAPGAHPVGAGLGAAGGAAAGMAAGAMAGPVGLAVGAAVGGIAGGLAGKGIAEAIDPTVENRYWQDHHPDQAWADPKYDYEDDYAVAYRYGYESYSDRGGSWAETENDLEAGWDSFKGKSRLTWERARAAVHAGWDRVERALPGDADHDGK